MKTVKAVSPYQHPGFLNFKTAPYEAWIKCGGQIADAHYPPRLLHGLAYRWELPTLWKSKEEARLRFVQPVSITFDTFPDYAIYEIIPIFWDCWPQFMPRVLSWLGRHHIKTAIFTSSQTAAEVRRHFPEMNVINITEGIDSTLFNEGKQLEDRTIDFLEYGRNIDRVVKYNFEGLNILRGQQGGKNLLSREQLLDAFQNSKVVAAFPKSMTDPKEAGDIETLTQRYWECMLSRMVLVGHAPKELVDLMGYNPVVELDTRHPNEQLRDIIDHIKDYQPMVDRNRKEALMKADWNLRIREIMKALKSFGYEI